MAPSTQPPVASGTPGRGYTRTAGALLSVGFLSLMLLFVVVVLLLSYHSYEAARGPLVDAEQTLSAVAHNPNGLDSSLGRDLTEIRLARAAQQIEQARKEIDDSFGLDLVQVIPIVAGERSGALQLVSDLSTSTGVSRQLLSALQSLATKSHGTTISLSGLHTFGRTLQRARTVLESEVRPTSGLIGPVGNARATFNREDSRAIDLLGQGVDLVHYALPFLGSDGPRVYLLVGENNAEMRAEGTVLSYALVHTRGGAVTVTPGSSIASVELKEPINTVPLPAGTRALFADKDGLEPTELWQSVNASADFALSGQLMQAMFSSATGTHVDGVIGIDVVALQGLLSLTGPVSVAGVSEPVDSQNASYVLLDELYQGLSPESAQAPRHEELTAVTAAAFHQLQSGRSDVVALARVLAQEVAGRHLQVWDADPSYESTLREVGASGEVDTHDPDGTFHVAVENATATKLDYFVDVAITCDVYLNPNGTAYVDTYVQLSNHAPPNQAPSYQLGPDGANSHIVGQYVGRVILWGPRGSLQAGSVPDSGLRASEVDTSVLPGQTETVGFETTIRGAVRQHRLHLVFVPQPRLAPESLHIRIFDPGSHTPRSTSLVLSETTQLTWEIG